MSKRFHFRQVRILVTSNCNLRCSHCYQHFEKNKFSLEKDIIFDIVNFLYNNEIEKLILSGGEFFIYPDAYAIIEYCMIRKIKTTVITNGTIIDLNYFKQHNYVDFLEFQFSIDGNELHHDERRGKGMYLKTMNAVNSLYDNGYTISASMAIDQRNFSDMIGVLENTMFSRVYFLPVATTGAAKLNEDKNAGKQEFEEILFRIYRSFCGISNSILDFPNEFAIKYDGKVYPSAVAQDMDVLCLGNILETNIEDILFKWTEGEGRGDLRYSLFAIPECNGCNSKFICNKGCRERAYKVYGKLDAPDPFCCRIYENKFSNFSLGEIFWGDVKLEK